MSYSPSLDGLISAPGHPGAGTPFGGPASSVGLAEPALAQAPAPRPARWPGVGGSLRFDLEASMVVFLVSLPLSLGIAVASGAPVMAGLTAAVVGGIVGGLVGGVPLQVSGPAAGLLAITAEMIADLGWALTCVVTAFAGGVQILLGLGRIARAALAISPAVVHGMLAGIGVTIAVGQANVLLGGASRAKAVESLLALPGQVTALKPAAAAIGLMAVGVMILWPRVPRLGRVVPAPLATVTLCTFASLPWTMSRVTLPANPLDAIALPALAPADWERLTGDLGTVLIGVITVALVASVESLLCSVAVDRLHDGPRADLDRELIGQGTSNIVSGALSGLPISAVIVRSSTNVLAGARTRRSSVLNGLWVASFAVALGPVLSRIPLPALAGLLVVIGVRLINPGHIRTVARHRELVSYLLTVFAVIALGLLEGVSLGYASALAIMLGRAVKAPMHLEPPKGIGEPWRVVVEGTLTFLALPRLSRQLAVIPAGAPVRLELLVDYLDHAAYEMLEDWSHGHRRTGGRVTVDEVGPRLMSQIEAGTAPTGRMGGNARAPRWLASWSDWQLQHTVTEGSVDVINGVEEFHRRTAPMVRDQLGALSAESPSTLFLTCSDSRIVPNVITSSGPGDLFTVRNVGALVPGPDDTCDSTFAAIEVAVAVLHVRTIVVCGHTGCSAMEALLMDPGHVPPALRSWLRHGCGSLARYEAAVPDPGLPEIDQLARANVVQQLENLRALEVVRSAQEQGRLRLVGMMFDIPAARALILDESTGRFTLPGGDSPRFPSRRATRRAQLSQTGSGGLDLSRIAATARKLLSDNGSGQPTVTDHSAPTSPSVGHPSR